MLSTCSGVEIVHGAIGDNIGVLIQWLSTFLAAIIVSLVIQYQLALLLLVIVPFMGIAGYTFTKVHMCPRYCSTYCSTLPLCGDFVCGLGGEGTISLAISENLVVYLINPPNACVRW